jgi:hypothetical protein
MYPTTSCLFVKDVFYLPDLLSDLTCEVFGLSFSLQIRIAGDLACFLFDFAFHFVKPAFNLILDATFHLFLHSGNLADARMGRISMAHPPEVHTYANTTLWPEL